MPVLPDGSVAAVAQRVAARHAGVDGAAVVTGSGPTQLSAAVAPGSTNAVAHSTVAGFGPSTVTTGAVVSATCTLAHDRRRLAARRVDGVVGDGVVADVADVRPCSTR